MDKMQGKDFVEYQQALNHLLLRYSKDGSTLFRKVVALDDFAGYSGIYILCFPGVYGYYIGKSKNIARRIRQHFSSPRTEFDRSFSFDEIGSIYILHCARDLLNMAEVDCIACIPKKYLLNRMVGGPFVQFINSDEYTAEKFLLKDELLQWLIDGAETARKVDEVNIRFIKEEKECRKAASMIKRSKATKITYEMCINAVYYQGEMLEYVPIEFRTHDLCLKALGMSCSAHNTFQFVPIAMRDKEICICALKNSEKPSATLKLIPEELLTEEFAEALVSERRSLLNKLPIKLQTPRVIQAAQPKKKRKKAEIST